MKKFLPLAIILCLLSVIAGFSIYQHFSSSTKFNGDYVNGNTAGNLYNSGLFCEHRDTVFFANPADSYRLYSMRKDGTDVRKISNDIVSYINADDNYLYYVRNNPIGSMKNGFTNINRNSLCRIDHDGKHLLVLDTAPCMYAALFGNSLFYLHYEESTATCLFRVTIDGSEQQQADQNPFLTCAADGQYFYHVGLDGSVYRYDTTSLNNDFVYAGNCWMPTVLENGDIFYMDCTNNYKLAESNLSEEGTVLLTQDRLDTYNLCGDYIYFQRSSQTDPALCRIRRDGSDYRVIAEGIYCNINATSTDVYFQEYGSNKMYRTPMDKPDTVVEFLPSNEGTT